MANDEQGIDKIDLAVAVYVAPFKVIEHQSSEDPKAGSPPAKTSQARWASAFSPPGLIACHKECDGREGKREVMPIFKSDKR